MPNKPKRDPALLCGFMKPNGTGCQNYKTNDEIGDKLEHCHLPSHQAGYVKPEPKREPEPVKKNKIQPPTDGMILKIHHISVNANVE